MELSPQICSFHTDTILIFSDILNWIASFILSWELCNLLFHDIKSSIRVAKVTDNRREIIIVLNVILKWGWPFN